MERRFPFGLSLGLFFMLGLLYGLGLYLRLPWQLWWYDIILHILGGFLASFVILEMLKSHQVSLRSLSQWIMAGLLISLGIGLLWECYELVSGSIFVTREGYMVDTGIDLACDIVGGIIAAFFSYKRTTTLWNHQK
jgi:hypothetical protein